VYTVGWDACRGPFLFFVTSPNPHGPVVIGAPGQGGQMIITQPATPDQVDAFLELPREDAHATLDRTVSPVGLPIMRKRLDG